MASSSESNSRMLDGTDEPAEPNHDSVPAHSLRYDEPRPTWRALFEIFPCVICQDTFNVGDCHAAPCGHRFCKDCLNQMFTLCVEDQSVFPPRCCLQKIALDDVRLSLDAKVVSTFEAKKEEYDDRNPMYCHKPMCSSYISKANQNDEENVATCPECCAKTCMECRRAEHDTNATKCGDDKEFIKTLELAREHGWRFCEKCGNMVERSEGCNHMTCRCKAEFCYVCGGPWPRCFCRGGADAHEWPDEEDFVEMNVEDVEEDRNVQDLRDQNADDWPEQDTTDYGWGANGWGGGWSSAAW